MFNPVLQQTISPAQEVAAPSGAAFGANALSGLLQVGGEALKQNYVAQQKQQESLVDERVSAAALDLSDIMANSSARNSTNVQQRLNRAISQMQQNGYSNAEIAAAVKQANTLSGTSVSASIKLERTEAEQMQKAEDDFNKEYADNLAFIPEEYRNDDGTAPVGDRAKMEAALFAARVNRGAFEERRLRAQTLSAEAGARLGLREEQSYLTAENYNTLLSGVIRNTMAYHANNPQSTAEDKKQAVIEGKLMIERVVNQDPTLLAKDRDKLIQGLNTTATMMEDILTGKMAADYTTKQQNSMMTRVLDYALKSDPGTFGLFLYSKMGLKPPDVAFKNIPISTFHSIAYGNPNSQSTLTVPELTPVETKQVWRAIATPEKQIDSPEVAQSFVEILQRGLQASKPSEVQGMLDKDGSYMWTLETLGKKDIADKYTDAVLGNQDFLSSFTNASGGALEVYIPLALNKAALGQKVKEGMKVDISGPYPKVQVNDMFKFEEVQGPNARLMGSKPSTSFDNNARRKAIAYPSVKAVESLNRILRMQHEAAVNIDRVAGTNLAKDLVNTQVQMLRQFIQE